MTKKKTIVVPMICGSELSKCFPMPCGSGGSTSKLATAAGAEPAGQMRSKKVHAVVARRTLPSQYTQKTPWSGLFCY